MKIFERKTSNRQKGTLTDHIAAYLENRQRRLADQLNRKFTGIPRRSLTGGLILFCVLFGGYLIYVMVTAFQ